jgi:isochorismate synthase
VDDFILQALLDLDAQGSPFSTVSIAVAPTPVERLRVPRGLGALLRWADPAPDRDGRAWSFVGLGEVARIDGTGDARLEQVRGAADELFASIEARVLPEAAFAPAPRLHGGIAFRPEAERAAPWTAFRDASFVLPRWLYGTCGDRAFLRVARRAGEPIDANAVRAVVEAFARPAPDARPPRHDPPLAEISRQSPEAWSALISDALASIHARELEKVVPMTLCKVSAHSGMSVTAALERLTELYPECVRFAFQRGDAVFLGASPERLVDKRGLEVASDALAGSAPRGNGGDARAALALLESDKDRREHRVVVDAVRAALAPLTARVGVPGAPVVRTLRNVHHLWTPITATLARPVHVLDLVRALHPTPAVCGTPRDAAFRWIAAHEPETRGWYAGAVGWFDAEGDGAFSVAIRSGVVTRGEAWLYAGAGIVEGSDAALEYAETRVKQAPMLAALGFAP